MGNAVGWDPVGVTTDFAITEPAVVSLDESLIPINLDQANSVCSVDDIIGGAGFGVKCVTAPPDLAELHYAVENLPSHVV